VDNPFDHRLHRGKKDKWAYMKNVVEYYADRAERQGLKACTEYLRLLAAAMHSHRVQLISGIKVSFKKHG
jgi:hypothetical protein